MALKNDDDGKPFYIPIFEIAGAAAIFGLLRRLDKATADVERLKGMVIKLAVGLVGLTIVTLFGGILLWLTR